MFAIELELIFLSFYFGNNSVINTFGRIDKDLISFYRKDIENNILSYEKAYDRRNDRVLQLASAGDGTDRRCAGPDPGAGSQKSTSQKIRRKPICAESLL